MTAKETKIHTEKLDAMTEREFLLHLEAENSKARDMTSEAVNLLTEAQAIRFQVQIDIMTRKASLMSAGLKG